jgi:hypothetical protein
LQIQTIRRRERRSVEEHVPAVLTGGVDEGKRMLYAGEVRLRGESE